MKYITVGDCCDILDSQRVPITASDRTKGIYPYYGANGVQDYVDDFLFDDELVLVAEDGGHFGSKDHPIAYRVSGKCWVNNHAHVLKPHEGIDVDYLCYSLMYYPVQSLIKGATRKKLNQADLHKMKIVLRPLDEQTRIVALIKEAEGESKICREIVAKLDTLVKSRFIEMFGDLALNPMNWKTMPIIEVCANKDDIKCGPFGTQLGKHEYVREGVPLWGIPQINAAFAVPPTDFLTEEKAEQLSAYSLIPGDIAMSRKGNVGKCAIYPDGESNGIIHSDVLRIRVTAEVCNPVFLMCQLHFSRAIESQIDAVSNGAVMAGINVTKLKNIIVHVPPIALQNQFAEFVQLADKSKSVLQKLLEKQELLQAALMQEYFE